MDGGLLEMSSLRRLLLAQSQTPSQITVVSDTFARANGNIGNAETGQTWSSNGASWLVDNGKARPSVGGTVAFIKSGLVDCDISVVGSLSGQIAIVFRWTDFGNHYRFRLLNNTAALLVIENGNTSVTSVPFTTTAKDYLLRVVNVGNSILCYVDGVLLISKTDNKHLTQTNQGIFSDTTSTFFDNYIVKTV